MKKLFLIIFLFLFSFITFSKEINIGISEPFLSFISSEVVFLSRQFPFEILFENEKGVLNFYIIRLENSFSEFDYLKNLRLISLKEGYDYFVYSYIFLHKEKIIFLLKLINSSSGRVVYSSIFLKEKNILVNEFLLEIVKKFLSDIKNLEIYKEDKEKSMLSKEVVESLHKSEESKKLRHEIFLLNSFFKNHSFSFSLVDFNVGYGFNIFNNFCVESGIFFGLGEKSINFSIIRIKNKDLYFGPFFSFYIFYPFFIEPRLGIRFELTFFIDKTVCFSFPIDFGIKFFITKRNAIKLSSSFQITSLKINKDSVIWKEDYFIGIMIGYAFKIY